MQPDAITLTAPDGRPLAGHHFPSRGDACVVIAPAMGVPAGYYRRFATWLASQGFDVLTFDYRGIGGSRQLPLRREPARLSQWAHHDLQTALARAATLAPRTALVTHSVGAQLLGLLEQTHGLRAIYGVASQLPFLTHFRGIERARASLLFRAVIPAATRAVGFFPGAIIGSEDLPPGIARDWARWGRSPRYVLSEEPSSVVGFARLDLPVMLVGLTDDTQYAPPASIDALADALPSARVERATFSPADAGAPIGHFGYFRSRHRDTLWPHATTYLQRALAMAPVG